MSEAIVNDAYLSQLQEEVKYNDLHILDKVPSDIVIAQSVIPTPIIRVAAKLGKPVSSNDIILLSFVCWHLSLSVVRF